MKSAAKRATYTAPSAVLPIEKSAMLTAIIASTVAMSTTRSASTVPRLQEKVRPGVLGEGVGPVGVAQPEPRYRVDEPADHYELRRPGDGREPGGLLVVDARVDGKYAPAHPPEDEAQVVERERQGVGPRVHRPEAVPGARPVEVEARRQEVDERRRDAERQQRRDGEYPPLQSGGYVPVVGARVHLSLAQSRTIEDAWRECQTFSGIGPASALPSPPRPAAPPRRRS